MAEGYLRVGAGVPKILVGDPEHNAAALAEMIRRADSDGTAALVLPELVLTGYTAADLFHQTVLLEAAEEALLRLIEETSGTDVLVAAGAPIRADDQLFNCAAVFHAGRLLGVVPKTYVPNYTEFYEYRWFAPASRRTGDEVRLGPFTVPFSNRLVFHEEASGAKVGVEICEDLWVPVPQSSLHAMAGALVMLNLSASPEAVGKADYRRDLVRTQSARAIAAYAYAGAGPTESTTDLVYSGHAMVAEIGTMLAEERFPREPSLLTADVDLERLEHDRLTQTSFMDGAGAPGYTTVSFRRRGQGSRGPIRRPIDRHPFVPDDPSRRTERCREIFEIQLTGLAERLAKTGIPKAVVAVSGGLDSTLALLVTAGAFERLGRPAKDVIGVTMPGLGTTGRTRGNALALMQALGISVREIPISEASLAHLRLIDHDPERKDVVYENVQARERTQVVMDIANAVSGLVVGTGDLSELALGWTTYNGDHMSMYGVNAGVPKTLVRYVIGWVADTAPDGRLRQVLSDIAATPVSPELLPPGGGGEIGQETEAIIGPYDLHDFFLYHVVRFGMRPAKLLDLASQAFEGTFSRDEIRKTLETFYRRFFRSQFKRSALPDGVKVGTVALSPRGDWRMPSDVSAEAWLKELDQAP